MEGVVPEANETAAPAVLVGGSRHPLRKIRRFAAFDLNRSSKDYVGPVGLNFLGVRRGGAGGLCYGQGGGRGGAMTGGNGFRVGAQAKAQRAAGRGGGAGPTWV
jgi:hypothetical protein